MKVVFDVRPVTARMAGIGRYCAGLVAELVRLGVDLVALGDSRTAWDRLPDALRRETLPDGARWHWSAHRRFRAHPGALYHSPSSGLVPAWIGAQAIVTVLDLAPALFPRTATLRTRLGYAVLRRAVHRVGAVVCGSHAARADLATHWQVDARVTPLAAPAWASPDDLGARATSEPYFLVVATREPRKNLPFVITAHAAACASDPSVPRLLVAGGLGWGPDVAPGDSCRILGYVEDRELLSLYRGARALIAPSLHEGFDLPLLEAMACGTPVLASSIAVHREIAGDAALWFDPADHGELIELLLSASRDPARLATAAERGRKAAAAYSWSRCASETLAVYRELLATAP